jgi:hypothetical protein
VCVCVCARERESGARELEGWQICSGLQLQADKLIRKPKLKRRSAGVASSELCKAQSPYLVD